MNDRPSCQTVTLGQADLSNVSVVNVTRNDYWVISNGFWARKR